MYRAKKDEAAMCGGATDCFVIHGSGGLIRITQGEMEKAESLGIMMDSLFDNAFTNLSIGGSEELQKFQSAEVADKYLKVAQQAQKVQFYSLRNYGIT